MENIWAFLLQTLSVSLVAGLLLLLKWLLRDKLSPRWQYAVWSILALRILLPVSVKRDILLPLSLWLETWKAQAEQHLASAYTGVYETISTAHGFPVLNLPPRSLTDWLFVAYTAGVVLCLLWYLLSYVRLRRLLRRGMDAPTGQLRRVAEAYGLPTCRVVSLPGLSAPFICGLFRPVLAVPEGKELDDKVLLHELLHLRCRDPWQTMGWAVLRSLHWCNPFLQRVFDRIGNDMESLCDQRVLERLAGEDRRSYGMILLQMANDRYARAPGTTSVSNGGKNITRRIEAIVRFRTYPKGTSLVSVCILIALLGPTLIGSAAAYNTQTFLPVRENELSQAMAAARIHRCTTMAGAIDTYAKGLMTENGVLIAAASPLSGHKVLETEMRRNCTEEDWVANHLDSGDELNYVNQSEGYEVFNLELVSKSSCRCVLGFSVWAFLNEDGIGWRTDADGNAQTGSVLIPILVHNCGGDWVVEEAGPRIISYAPLDDQALLAGDLEPMRRYAAEGVSGSAVLDIITCYSVQNTVQQEGLAVFSSSASFDTSPKLSAQFQQVTVWNFGTYTCAGDSRPEASLELQFVKTAQDGTAVDSGSSSERISEGWDGTSTFGGGGGYSAAYLDEVPAPLAEEYSLLVYWDGQLADTLDLQEVQP